MKFRSNASALSFQIRAYKLARACMVTSNLKSVLDIGCGNPQKLRFLLAPFSEDITGIDLPENVQYINEEFGEWIGCDIEKSMPEIDKVFDLVIAADIIEHLHEPKKLVELIKHVSDDKTLIIMSTPAKESLPEYVRNIDHHSEFTTEEIKKFLTESGFIIEQYLEYAEETSAGKYKDNVFCLRLGDKKNGSNTIRTEKSG